MGFFKIIIFKKSLLFFVVVVVCLGGWGGVDSVDVFGLP